MAKTTEEVVGQTPHEVMTVLKNKASEFEITAESDGNAQTIRCRIDKAGQNSIGYIYTRIFPGRMFKEVLVTISLKPSSDGRGTAVTLRGKHLRTEAPPGTQIDDGGDIMIEAATVWTHLKNIVMQEVNAGKIETLTRTYNAGTRELFQLLKDPGLLVPASYITVEKDETGGRVKFQDPTGSLVYLIERTDCQEPDKVTYTVESNTSNMWVRKGNVELTLERVHESKSVLTARAVPARTQLSEQMRMSAMYLPAEQLSGYLSFRQDLGILMSWIDAAVPLQIPHIRDMIVVQGDFVAGGKVEIRDSVVNRTQIETGGASDNGRFVVHASRNMETKVDIRDSVVNRTDISGNEKNVEIYQKCLQTAIQDGRIEDNEAAMIDMLQRSLGITPEDNLRALEGLHLLEKEHVKQYEQILSAILASGMIGSSDEGALETLRIQNGIPHLIHQALITRFRSR
jgi:uncharacterized protein YndB with AHSA1/START domain